MVQVALVPIVPILLLPVFLVGFIILFPLWATALIVLGVLRGLGWIADRVIGIAGIAPRAEAPFARAFRWVLTFGGFI